MYVVLTNINFIISTLWETSN